VAGIIQSHIDEDSENKVSIHSGVLFLGGDDSSDEIHSIERTKENLRKEINNIERYIRKTEPRVVNLSISESSSQLLIGAAVSEAFAEVEDISKKEAINRFVNQSNELHDFQKRLMVNMMKKFPETLFVIAAGNDSRDLRKANKKHNFNSYDQLVRKIKRGSIKGIHTLYSQIKLPNTIIVGSVDAYKIKPADFSNYSSRHVDILAEGDKVMSAAPGGDYIEKSGTSMAAPQVSGVAADYLQQNPELNTTELKDKILNDASIHLRLCPYVNNGRLLNLPY
jgi:subtilisin family serine protease